MGRVLSKEEAEKKLKILKLNLLKIRLFKYLDIIKITLNSKSKII